MLRVHFRPAGTCVPRRANEPEEEGPDHHGERRTTVPGSTGATLQELKRSPGGSVGIRPAGGRQPLSSILAKLGRIAGASAAPRLDNLGPAAFCRHLGSLILTPAIPFSRDKSCGRPEEHGAALL